MENGRIFKNAFFGFSKKQVLEFFEKLNDTQKKANEKKDKEISRLQVTVTELAEEVKKLKTENCALVNETEKLKSQNFTAVNTEKPVASEAQIPKLEAVLPIAHKISIDQAIDEAKSFYSSILSSGTPSGLSSVPAAQALEQPELPVLSKEKEFNPKNSDLYCELMKEIETLRQEKDETKRQFEEAIAEIRDGYEKKLADKNDEIYARRQKYFNAVMEHIQYKRAAEKQITDMKKDQ